MTRQIQLPRGVLPDAIRKIQEGLDELVAQKLVLDQHAIVSMADRDQRITYVNTRFCEVSKYEKAELIGRSYNVLEANHHPQSFFEEMWSTVKGGGVWHGNIKNKAKDGSTYWVKSTITPLFDQDGAVCGSAEMQTDITHQVLAEEAAAKSGAALQEALNELQTQKLVLDDHAIVSMTDRGGNITYVNDHFCEIAKYDRSELIGRNHRVLNSGHHPLGFFKEMWKTIASGNVWHGQIKNRAKDGSYYWVQSTVRPVRDNGGQIIGYASVRTDITEQKAAEQAAANAHDRLALATQASGVVLWDLSPRLGTLELSESFASLFGCKADEVPQDTAGFLHMVHPEDFETARQMIEHLGGGEGNEVNREFRMRGRNSEYLWVRIIGRTIARDHGKLHALGALSDVTAEKEAVRSMSNEKLALERIVTERTRDLEEQAQALSEALRKEQELNEMQRQFVSMASHEFRTPLAIIDSSAQYVARRIDKLKPDAIRENIDTMRGAVRRMTNLMESTLSAAKMDAGKLRMKPADCNIRTLVEEVCQQQQRIAQAHKVSLDVGDLPDVIQGDYAALELVFANLLSNAVKYAPNAPEVSVKGWTEGEFAYVSVADHGIGIDAEDVERLFSRFFRAKSATGIAGTGIGLNLVKRLVDSHGGEITVQSAIGEGSKFTVKLPIKGPSDQAESVEAA